MQELFGDYAKVAPLLRWGKYVGSVDIIGVSLTYE